MTVDSGFLRLEKTSLRQQALSALRKAITTGQIKPGTHLVETELSEALQISRGTLREAMRQLQQEGLISAGARGRLSVRHLDTKEIRDIFGVRAALEALAASELASRPDRADAVAALRGAVEDMDRCAAAELEDRIEADLRFHRTMCRLTGNETLMHSWTSLEGSIRMSIMYAGVERALKNMDAKRHLEIVDAASVLPLTRSSRLWSELTPPDARAGEAASTETAVSIRQGRPVAEVLAELTDTGADVLTFGCHRGGPAGMLEAGGTARHLLHTAPVSVLTIPL